MQGQLDLEFDRGRHLGQNPFNERFAALIARSRHVEGIDGLRPIDPQGVVEVISAWIVGVGLQKNRQTEAVQLHPRNN